MAAAFSAGVYGEIKGQPPYNSANPFAAWVAYPSNAIGIHNFNVGTTNIHPINPGFAFNGVYCYSVIEEVPTGLTGSNEGRKFAVKESVATLANLRG
jgi:hypothetical protein